MRNAFDMNGPADTVIIVIAALTQIEIISEGGRARNIVIARGDLVDSSVRYLNLVTVEKLVREERVRLLDHSTVTIFSMHEYEYFEGCLRNFTRIANSKESEIDHDFSVETQKINQFIVI